MFFDCFSITNFYISKCQDTLSHPSNPPTCDLKLSEIQIQLATKQLIPPMLSSRTK
jgi:hypothetical protein